MKIDDAEYSKLKSFLSVFVDRFVPVAGLSADDHPVAKLGNLEKENPNLASRGLLQAINDCIEMSFRLNNNEIVRLDHDLRTRGIITISELRRRYSGAYKAVSKRRRIRSETEYYMAINVLNDPTPKIEQDRELLQSLIADYEVRHAGYRPSHRRKSPPSKQRK